MWPLLVTMALTGTSAAGDFSNRCEPLNEALVDDPRLFLDPGVRPAAKRVRYDRKRQLGQAERLGGNRGERLELVGADGQRRNPTSLQNRGVVDTPRRAGSSVA